MENPNNTYTPVDGKWYALVEVHEYRAIVYTLETALDLIVQSGVFEGDEVYAELVPLTRSRRKMLDQFIADMKEDSDEGNTDSEGS